MQVIDVIYNVKLWKTDKRENKISLLGIYKLWLLFIKWYFLHISFLHNIMKEERENGNMIEDVTRKEENHKRNWVKFE